MTGMAHTAHVCMYMGRTQTHALTIRLGLAHEHVVLSGSRGRAGRLRASCMPRVCVDMVEAGLRAVRAQVVASRSVCEGFFVWCGVFYRVGFRTGCKAVKRLQGNASFYGSRELRKCRACESQPCHSRAHGLVRRTAGQACGRHCRSAGDCALRSSRPKCT